MNESIKDPQALPPLPAHQQFVKVLVSHYNQRNGVIEELFPAVDQLFTADQMHAYLLADRTTRPASGEAQKLREEIERFFPMMVPRLVELIEELFVMASTSSDAEDARLLDWMQEFSDACHANGVTECAYPVKTHFSVRDQLNAYRKKINAALSQQAEPGARK